MAQSSYCHASPGIDPYMTSASLPFDGHVEPPNLAEDFEAVGFDTDQCLVGWKMPELAKLVC
jgi:hypothetical protein